MVKKNNSVEIRLEFNDDESSVEAIKEFFIPIASVQINKAEPRAVKTWGDNAIEIFLMQWAAKRFILDPLADNVDQWIKGIKAFWEKSGYQRAVNIIVKFEQGQENFEIQLIGNHEPDVLKQVWCVFKDVMEFLQTQNSPVDKIRIISNRDKSLLIIGYSGSQPKYTINLDKKEIRPIKSSSAKCESDYDPEVELTLISVLERRLNYLKLLKQNGYDISESEITDLEVEIQSKKDRFYL